MQRPQSYTHVSQHHSACSGGRGHCSLLAQAHQSRSAAALSKPMVPNGMKLASNVLRARLQVAEVLAEERRKRKKRAKAERDSADDTRARRRARQSTESR